MASFINKNDIPTLSDKGLFSEIALHFARLMTRLSGQDNPELFLAAALVSRATSEGHVCLDLSSLDGKSLLGPNESDLSAFLYPPSSEWEKILCSSSVVGRPGDFRPLILDNRSRLYLYRYWEYEKALAVDLRTRATNEIENIDIPLLINGLSRLFPQARDGRADWQKVAAFVSVTKRLCVICGGPGTGKTATVSKMLVLLLEQAAPGKPHVFLVAPTGKAAARLEEAINHATRTLNCKDSIKKAMPERASTIHRLLGSIPDSPYFRHNAKNRLPADIVVLDEASMVDLALMSKLVRALPPQTRLILLGDKNQLSSVEAGAVLGDICNTGNFHTYSKRFRKAFKRVMGYEINTGPYEQPQSEIGDCMVELLKSYRFDKESGINEVGAAVSEGDEDRAAALLMGSRHGDMKWRELPGSHVLDLAIKDIIIKEFRDHLRSTDPLEIFRLFERFRILAALREGPYGVVNLNRLVEQILKEKKLIQPESKWYAGRPILITRNDYTLALFNGDVGIVLPDSQVNNDLRVFFPAPNGTLRKFDPLRLPEHETVYAMTVHKSQGSEFDRVLLILPDRESSVLTRELLYTGITRARKSVEIWGTESVLRTAVHRRTKRASGLRDALWRD